LYQNVRELCSESIVLPSQPLAVHYIISIPTDNYPHATFDVAAVRLDVESQMGGGICGRQRSICVGFPSESGSVFPCQSSSMIPHLSFTITELRDRPDQLTRYHNLHPQLQTPHLTQHLVDS